MIFADYGREENQVWLNNNGHFTNVAHQLGIDYDNRMDYTTDQSYECYCANYPDPTHCTPMPPVPIVDCCEFCQEDGYACPSFQCPPTFRGWEPGVTDQPYSLGGNYFSFACGDINDDGFMDSHERHDRARRRRHRRGPERAHPEPGRRRRLLEARQPERRALSRRARVHGPVLEPRRRHHGHGGRRPRRVEGHLQHHDRCVRDLRHPPALAPDLRWAHASVPGDRVSGGAARQRRRPEPARPRVDRHRR